MGFGQTMNLMSEKKYAVKKLKNEGYWTSYGFALIRIYVEEELWGLDKLWIWCLLKSRRRGRDG